MPTSKPRISVTLSPATAAVLQELSERTGNSQSAIVGELLESNQGLFTRMVRVLGAAKEAQVMVREEVMAGIEAAQARLETQLGLVLDDTDEQAGSLLADVEAVQRRGARGAGVAAQAAPAPRKGRFPPISNRGVTPSKSVKKGKKSRGGHGPV